MNSMQSSVDAFLIKHLGRDDNGWPKQTGLYNKWLLIKEEYDELTAALGFKPKLFIDTYEPTQPTAELDKAQVIKELCDCFYVLMNLAEELRVDIQPFFDEVHVSNMTKTPAALSPNKKIMKGFGYQPPDIKGMLEELDGLAK